MQETGDVNLVTRFGHGRRHRVAVTIALAIRSESIGFPMRRLTEHANFSRGGLVLKLLRSAELRAGLTAEGGAAGD